MSSYFCFAMAAALALACYSSLAASFAFWFLITSFLRFSSSSAFILASVAAMASASFFFWAITSCFSLIYLSATVFSSTSFLACLVMLAEESSRATEVASNVSIVLLKIASTSAVAVAWASASSSA